MRVDHLGGRGPDVLGARVLDTLTNIVPADEFFAQVRVQPLLDLGDELVGGADQQVVERAPLEAGEERLERLAEWCGFFLLDGRW